MGKNDQTAIIIVSALTLILVFGLLFKSYMVLFPGENESTAQADSTLMQVYDDEIKQGPALVEDIPIPTSKPKPTTSKPERVQKTSPTESTKSAKATSGETFIVVSGAFSSRKNAEERKSELTGKGYSPEIYYQKDRGLYLVYLMKFNSRSQAANYSHRTKAKGLDNFIKIIRS